MAHAQKSDMWSRSFWALSTYVIVGDVRAVPARRQRRRR